MRTFEITTKDDEYYQQSIKVQGRSNHEHTMIEAKSKNKGKGIGSDYVYIYPTPEQVRAMRKALQQREAELVQKGFLVAECPNEGAEV
jgi:hypothetical protein